MRQERRPTGLGYIISPSANSNTKRKEVKPEGNDYLQKTHHNWTKLTDYKDLALNKTRKPTKGVSNHVSTVHFVVAMEKITNPWYQMFHIKPKLLS